MEPRPNRRRDELGRDDASITRLLIDSVADYAIFVLDPRGYVRTWNRGARRLKGYELDEVVGQHFSIFYTPEAKAAGLPDALLVRAETEGAIEHSGWRVRRDGTTFWGNVTITALRDDAGELVGFAKVTRDLTEMHEHEEALGRALALERAATTELERLHRTRTRFMAAIVHDLSTPITVLRSSLQLLDTFELDGDDDLAKLLSNARRNADDLEELRAQLQEFARLEGGSMSLDVAPIDLAKVADQVAADFSTILGSDRLQVEMEPTVEVAADELALRRILTNLVANAARYGPEDRPVRLVTAPADSQDHIAVGVIDEGPGISPADQQRVFQEFWSGRGGTRPGSGLGLGLNIAQGYVHEHGGQIWIESDDGNGTTFWFTLPRA